MLAALDPLNVPGLLDGGSDGVLVARLLVLGLGGRFLSLSVRQELGEIRLPHGAITTTQCLSTQRNNQGRSADLDPEQSGTESEEWRGLWLNILTTIRLMELRNYKE